MHLSVNGELAASPPPAWVDRYVGIPYRDGTDAHNGASCWGLCRLVYRELLGIELREYGNISSDDLLALAQAFDAGRQQYGDFIEIKRFERGRIRPFDLVLMRSFDLPTRELRAGPTHIGLMVSFGSMLQVDRRALSHCTPIDEPKVWARVLSFHRHKAMAG